MSESLSRFKIASEETNPGGTTIIKIVDGINNNLILAFAAYCSSTGEGTLKSCPGIDSITSFDLINFIRKEKNTITWNSDICYLS